MALTPTDAVPIDRPDPEQPYVDWPTLANAWALRDDAYARLSLPLTDAAIAAVREGRKREVWYLPPEQRAFAWGQVQGWYPPEHGR